MKTLQTKYKGAITAYELALNFGELSEDFKQRFQGLKIKIDQAYENNDTNKFEELCWNLFEYFYVNSEVVYTKYITALKLNDKPSIKKRIQTLKRLNKKIWAYYLATNEEFKQLQSAHKQLGQLIRMMEQNIFDHDYYFISAISVLYEIKEIIDNKEFNNFAYIKWLKGEI
ncbi:hypothetical protein [Mycoplasma seminis]|uniref:Uncharacterized protein n=1 Tax=Mycoplasma seminis TaxID=512749 RepID=A0ABY9HC53_9MOLU|nr:hypothetical protein [Mycoplasma seminis]WLP85263.1 hypothetical protein Q8852_02990 [Mycoplasma seminis]